MIRFGLRFNFCVTRQINIGYIIALMPVHMRVTAATRRRTTSSHTCDHARHVRDLRVCLGVGDSDVELVTWIWFWQAVSCELRVPRFAFPDASRGRRKNETFMFRICSQHGEQGSKRWLPAIFSKTVSDTYRALAEVR